MNQNNPATREQQQKIEELSREGVYIYVDTHHENVFVRSNLEKRAEFDGLTEENIDEAIEVAEGLK